MSESSEDSGRLAYHHGCPLFRASIVSKVSMIRDNHQRHLWIWPEELTPNLYLSGEVLLARSPEFGGCQRCYAIPVRATGRLSSPFHYRIIETLHDVQLIPARTVEIGIELRGTRSLSFRIRLLISNLVDRCGCPKS